tara:strand:+ start:576 stop:1703 length:1128 start_codon:yes stop_codon:yes gene_type:complete
MKYLYTIIIGLLCNQLSAQIIDCDCESRYQSEIFSDVSVQTVTYSEPHDLQMDIYTPLGDVCNNRPLLIFAHGGTFIFGTKTNPTMVDLCETFARKGYVTASINYRLAADIVGFFAQFTYYTNTQSAYEVVLNAVMDGKAAIRYFRKDIAENGNNYGIDPNQIWGGGNSAGGVLFLHAAHVGSTEEFTLPLDDNRASIANNIIESIGGFEGSSGNEGYSSELSGVISLAGALHRSEYLDSNDVPSVFCHGDEDSVVPYDCNGFQNNPSFDQLCGGGALYPDAISMGINTDLLTFPNDDHCPWDASSSKMQDVKDFVSDFLYSNIDCNSVGINEDLSYKELICKKDLLGRTLDLNQKGLVFNIYNDGSVQKKYIIK